MHSREQRRCHLDPSRSWLLSMGRSIKHLKLESHPTGAKVLTPTAEDTTGGAKKPRLVTGWTACALVKAGQGQSLKVGLGDRGISGGEGGKYGVAFNEPVLSQPDHFERTHRSDW